MYLPRGLARTAECGCRIDRPHHVMGLTRLSPAIGATRNVLGVLALLAVVVGVFGYLSGGHGRDMPLTVVWLGLLLLAIVVSWTAQRRRLLASVFFLVSLAAVMAGVLWGSVDGFITTAVVLQNVREYGPGWTHLVSPYALIALGVAGQLIAVGTLLSKVIFIRIAAILGAGVAALEGTGIVLGLVYVSRRYIGWELSQTVAVVLVTTAVMGVVLATVAVLPGAIYGVDQRLVARSPDVSTEVGDRKSRRWGQFALVTGIVITGVLLVPVGRALIPSDPVDELIEDEALARCVLRALGRADDSTNVSSADLATVSDLNCEPTQDASEAAITSLAGISELTQLYSLNLTGHSINDLAPLQGMTTLVDLRLTGNVITDLSPLSQVNGLRNLGLSGNQITDVTPLANLAVLSHLGVADNHLESLAGLDSIASLETVDASDNQVADLGPLAVLPNLRRLTLRNNAVSELDALADSQSLEYLQVANNEISDAAEFVVIESLTEIWLGGNPLSDISALAGMPNLVGVDIAESEPGSITGVAAVAGAGIHVGS